MARRQLSYSELRVALFVLATVALLIVGIFYVTGEGAWQSKYTITTYLPEADTLNEGAPVSLGGVIVGNVKELAVNPNPQTPDQNIEVQMWIYSRYRQWIRANSTATLQTQGALGSRFVEVTRGTPPYSIVPPDGTIQGIPASTIQTVVNEASDLMQNELTPMAKDLRGITDQIHAGKGTIGELLYSDKLATQLTSATASFNDLATGLKQGRGTAGKILTSDALWNRTNAAIDRVDAILAAVQQQKGSLGKLIYDPSFANNANAFLTKGNTLLTGAEEGKGSLGQFVTNPALFNNANQSLVNLRDLTAKMNRGQGTAGQFFTDPQLYDNLTGLTGDLRLFLGDVRKNPKKYMHVKLSIF